MNTESWLAAMAFSQAGKLSALSYSKSTWFPPISGAPAERDKACSASWRTNCSVDAEASSWFILFSNFV